MSARQIGTELGLAATRRLGFLLPFLLAVAIVACNGDERESEPDVRDGTPAFSPPAGCPMIDGEIAAAMVARLDVDKTSYERGEPVEMTLRLINCADEPVTRHFPDGQTYDFKVFDEAGFEIWRWGRGMMFDQELREETFQPGEEITFVEAWDQTDNDGEQVPEGRYELRGESSGCDSSLLSCGPASARVVEIVAP